MPFTPNWNLEKATQGTVRFDTPINNAISDIDGLIGGGTITAGENLSIRDVVGVKADSKAWKVAGGGPTTAIGFVKIAALATLPCRVQTSGRLSGFVGLTPGGVVWSDGSGGTTQVKPSTSPQKIGMAISATEIEIDIEPPEDSTIVKAASNNKKVVFGTASVTGSSLDVVSGLSAIDSVVASIAAGDPAYEPTLNEMAVRVQKSGTAGKFHIYVSKLDGSSAGRWVAGTTVRNIHWIAIGDA